jgi:hypothetical protein
MQSSEKGLRPLVIGYPRTGFTLLISVISEICNRFNAFEVVPGQALVRAFCDTAGLTIAEQIETACTKMGLLDDLIYNNNFKQMVGGPKWMRRNNHQTACFRKYIGIRGMGDFTLFTSHPLQVLDYYDVTHSHVRPAAWPAHSSFRKHRLFASIRHPAGTLASACFSLNALASEYIQRFVTVQDDNDLIRQRHGLYKLSNLDFFDGLITPFKAYLEEFNTCSDHYFVMRWEDLIQHPVPTILTVAKALRISITSHEATKIWQTLDHVNLTGAHKHNLRKGHGIVNGWRNWLTNTHIQIIKDHGLEALVKPYGYGPIAMLDPADYTPFQKKLDDLLKHKTIFSDYGDEDLFGFAFNKSNLDLNRFQFKQYEWRTHTRVERSSCKDDAIVMALWDAAEAACARINQALDILITVLNDGEVNKMEDAINDILSVVAALFSEQQFLDHCRNALLSAAQIRTQHQKGDGPKTAPMAGAALSVCADPEIVQVVGAINIIAFNGLYYSVPQKLGPIDFFTENATEKPGVAFSENLSQLLSQLSAHEN